MPLIGFLILSSCVVAPKPEPVVAFKGRWSFCTASPPQVLACLNETDLKVLRETLVRCQQNEDNSR